MARDDKSGFADPEDFKTVPASLGGGFTPLTPVPAGGAPQTAMQGWAQAQTEATVSRFLANEGVGVHQRRGTTRASTYVIATSDATPEEKAGADIVCDGYEDENEINNAFVDDYDVLVLGPTLFVDSADISVPAGRVLSGIGLRTLINCRSTFGVVLAGIKASVQGLRINDQGGSGDKGITLAEQCYIADVQVANFTYGIYGDGSSECQFVNLRTDGNTNGVYLTDTDRCVFAGWYSHAETTSLTLINGCLYNNVRMISFSPASYGVKIDGSNSNLLQAVIEGYETDGILIDNNSDYNLLDSINLRSTVLTAGNGINIANANCNENYIGTVHWIGFGTEISDSGTSTRKANVHTHANYANGGQIAAASVTIADAGNDFTATTVEGALDELQADNEAHLADTSDAHDASAISIADSGGFITGTDVEAAIQELGRGTGNIQLPSPAWTGLLGSPAETSYDTSAGTSQGFGGIAMDGGATYESIRTAIILPTDWVSGLTIKIRFALAVAAGAGQDVRLEYRIIARANNETIADTTGDFDTGNTSVSVASAAQFHQFTIDFTPTITLAADDTVMITIGRDPGAAADDYANDIFFIAARVEYTRSHTA